MKIKEQTPNKKVAESIKKIKPKKHECASIPCMYYGTGGKRK